MSHSLGRLLFPAIRWSDDNGFEDAQPAIDQALSLGVGGFILFGGPADEVRVLTEQLHSASRAPLLIAADLERGAGQQFAGATPLPPVAAIGMMEDAAVTRRAGELTAREARALGVNWVYAPDADVDLEPRNPIIGTRAFGTDPERVAMHVAAWVNGCRAGEALSCAKHFPGHGRTTGDSHAELPTVIATRADLEQDLAPFRAAIKAGVDSVMTAHVAYLAYDASGAPATLSPHILQDLLRDRLEFDGLVVTDALIMEGVLDAGRSEGHASVLALQAGCDALLYPADAAAVAEAIERAAGKQLHNSRIDDAMQRIDRAAARVNGQKEAVWGKGADAEWALDLAQRCLQTTRGVPRIADRITMLTIDDDLGGPYPPGPRTTFPEALRVLGKRVTEVSSGPVDVIPVYCETRAWKGRPGLSGAAIRRVETLVQQNADALIVLFAHPRLAAGLAGSTVLSAWGGEPLMQRAAAHWLVERS